MLGSAIFLFFRYTGTLEVKNLAESSASQTTKPTPLAPIARKRPAKDDALVADRNIIWSTLNAMPEEPPEEPVARLGYALGLILPVGAPEEQIKRGLAFLLESDIDAEYGDTEKLIATMTSCAFEGERYGSLYNVFRHTERRGKILSGVLSDWRRILRFLDGQRIPLEGESREERVAAEAAWDNEKIGDAIFESPECREIRVLEDGRILFPSYDETESLPAVPEENAHE